MGWWKTCRLKLETFRLVISIHSFIWTVFVWFTYCIVFVLVKSTANKYSCNVFSTQWALCPVLDKSAIFNIISWIHRVTIVTQGITSCRWGLSSLPCQLRLYLHHHRVFQWRQLLFLVWQWLWHWWGRLFEGQFSSFSLSFKTGFCFLICVCFRQAESCNNKNTLWTFILYCREFVLFVFLFFFCLVMECTFR